MASDDDDARGFAAVGERDVERCRSGDAGSDTGNDFERNASLLEGVDLFSEATEDGGIAAFEPDNPQAALGAIDHELVDFGLSDSFGATALADIEDLGSWASQREDFAADQIVMKNKVRTGDQAIGLYGEERRIARARTHQVDGSWDGFGHGFVLGFGCQVADL